MSHRGTVTPLSLLAPHKPAHNQLFSSQAHTTDMLLRFPGTPHPFLQSCSPAHTIAWFQMQDLTSVLGTFDVSIKALSFRLLKSFSIAAVLSGAVWCHLLVQRARCIPSPSTDSKQSTEGPPLPLNNQLLPLEPDSTGRSSLTLPQLVTLITWQTAPKALASHKGEQQIALIHGSSHFFRKGRRHESLQVNPQLSQLPPILHMPGNISQEDLLHALPRVRGKADWPTAPQISCC